MGVAEECIRNASCTASYYTRFACRHSSIPAVCGDTLIMYMISSTLPVSQLLAWPNVIIGVAFDMLLVSRHSSVSQSVSQAIDIPLTSIWRIARQDIHGKGNAQVRLTWLHVLQHC